MALTNHRVIFGQIVLNGRSGQDDATLAVERLQRFRRFCAGRLEAVTFVADEQSNRRLTGLDFVDAGAQLSMADVCRRAQRAYRPSAPCRSR